MIKRLGLWASGVPAPARGPCATPPGEGATWLRRHVVQLAGEIGERNVYRRLAAVTDGLTQALWMLAYQRSL